MRALLVTLLIHLTLNPLIYLKGRNVFKDNKLIKNIWSFVFIAELSLFVIVLLFSDYLPDPFVHFVRVLATSWFLFVVYCGGIILIYDFIYLIIKRRLSQPLEIENQPKNFKQPLFIVTLAFVVAVLIHGKYKFEHPVVTHHQIAIDKPAQNHESLKVLVAGDLHLGYTIDRDDAHRMVNLIMAQNADLILMVGDIIDASIKPLIKEQVADELKRLSAPLGVYTCPGNHEYRNEAADKFAFLNAVGIKVLRDTIIQVDSSFYIAGREDVVIGDRLSLKQLIEVSEIDNTKPLFVLNHTPNNLDEEMDSNVDLALYGHTHHGQAFPGNLATDLRFELAYGYKKKRNTHFYVTSGLGLAGPQHRIGTVSEVALFEVTFND